MFDQLPKELIDFDKGSREEWSVYCAASLCQVTTHEGRLAMVVRGFDEFLRIARIHYAIHALKTEDYRRIFNILEAKVQIDARAAAQAQALAAAGVH